MKADSFRQVELGCISGPGIDELKKQIIYYTVVLEFRTITYYYLWASATGMCGI